ncbi:MAG: alanine--tRNA ligase [Eubacteriales bacterium]|nr:alanine--tRNA ligase [Eubacteriales bacterium]
MKQYGVNELRKMFLEFFESKDHLAMKSFSLVPRNDKSLLLINSGMAPLKPYFTGLEVPPRKRVTTCQKCIRTGDIENVGKTARHGTFFEMLGNFSFGDYFKREAIHWSWEFLTEVVGLEADRLYPSVYEEDDEAFAIWHEEMGIAKERIFRFGKADNFWEHGAGPCGPCSEIYYDRGIKYGCDDPNCTVGCECDRFIEVWNNVFTQFDNDGEGHYTELEQKNIDTGMGLERLAVVVQDVDSIFDVDTIRAIRDRVCELAGVTYKSDAAKDVSIRLITDHIRSSTFMISDGIMPTNEGRGYVLRKIIRRAARHGRLLGIEGLFMAKLAQTVIDESKDGYPELEEKQAFIFKVLTQEEEQFNKTIDQGLTILAQCIEELQAKGETVFAGSEAFRLYDTYGFPYDLTVEIMEEKGIAVDAEGYQAAMDQQKKKARESRQTSNYMGADSTVYDLLDPAMETTFVGYDRVNDSAEILALTTDNEVVESLEEGMQGTIFVPQTPFYATKGGQLGDTGVIRFGEASFRVDETILVVGDKIAHIGEMTAGTLRIGDRVELQVDAVRRNRIRANHSATHLLQKALKTVLGEHVEQKGSLVTDEYLRFDFSHFSPMTKEELTAVTTMVNEQIQAKLPVVTEVMSIEEAKKSGAMALFDEKYGDSVRVLTMGDFSKELCGGTHVDNTADIRSFKITSESGVAAGVRRIVAITKDAVDTYYQKLEDTVAELCKSLKSDEASLADKVANLHEQLRELRSENDSLKTKLAAQAAGDLSENVTKVGDFAYAVARVDDVDMNALRDLGDRYKEVIGEGVVLLFSVKDGKVNILSFATEQAVSHGAHAGNLIREVAGLVGGGGGGRPNQAQAGGKNPAGIAQAMEQAKLSLEKMLS